MVLASNWRQQRRDVLWRLAMGNQLRGRGHHGLLMGAGGGGGGGGDPDFANVKALLHFNGTNGSTTYTDVIGHTFTDPSGVGTMALSTAVSKFGTASLANSPINGSYIECASSADFATNGAYTIEGWARIGALNNNGSIFNILNAAGGTIAGRLYHRFTNGLLKYENNTTGIVDTSYSVAVDGAFHHYAISQAAGGAGATVRCFVDGNLVLTTTADAGATTGIPRVGFYGSINCINGWVDDFRFTKGVNRYTTAFTPPAAQFPDS